MKRALISKCLTFVDDCDVTQEVNNKKKLIYLYFILGPGCVYKNGPWEVYVRLGDNDIAMPGCMTCSCSKDFGLHCCSLVYSPFHWLVWISFRDTSRNASNRH